MVKNMIVVDGLLCSIVKAQTRTVNDYELVEAIGRDIDEKEASGAHRATPRLKAQN